MSDLISERQLYQAKMDIPQLTVSLSYRWEPFSNILFGPEFQPVSATEEMLLFVTENRSP
jgi:hypothetical protein